MDSRFATAFFLGRWTVYGYRLKPFCLLHSVQLEAIGSPLEVGGEITPAHLMGAAQICSELEPVTEVTGTPRKPGSYDHAYELEKWRVYVAECRSRPATYQRPSKPGGHDLNAPWQQIIVTYLMLHARMGRMEAWTMPEGQAMWQYYSLREQLENDSLILSEEAEREMAEQERAKLEDAPRQERIMRALLWRDEQQRAGKWSRTEKGTWVPFDPENPEHYPPE